MRTLNEFERDLLRELLEANGRGVPNLASMLDKRLEDVDLVRTGNIWEMHFSATAYQPADLVHATRWLARDLVSAVHLLRELEVNGFAFLYREAPFDRRTRFGRLVQGQRSIAAPIQDTRLNQLLDETAFSSILVNPGLIAYVRDGFRMPEEVRADNDLRMNRRNLRIAAWALVLGVGIGLWQVCLAYREVHYGKLQVEQTQQVQLDPAQYRTLLDRMEAASRMDTTLVPDSTLTRKACCAKH